MPWIIAWSLKFRMAVVVAAVAISAIGIAQLRNAPVDVAAGVHPAVRRDPDRGARAVGR